MDAPVVQPQHNMQGFDRRVLARPGTPISSTWPRAEQGNKCLLDEALLLAENHPADALAGMAQALAQRLDLAGKRFGAGGLGVGLLTKLWFSGVGSKSIDG